MKASIKAAVATTFLLSGARAQDQYKINPASVTNTTRDYWCEQQIAQCPLICLDQGSSTGTTSSNACNPDILTYSCVCDDGTSPNVSEYSNTLPYSICTEWGTQCVANCGADSQCASDCRAYHPCGARNPTRQNTSTLTRTMSSTTAATSGGLAAQVVTTDADGSTVTVYSGGLSGSSSAGVSVKNVRVWALNVGQTFGTMGLIGGVALGFAVLL